MKITIKKTTETIGGKEYPLTITRQIGLQEIQVDGKPLLVEELAIYDSPLGQSRCYTRARPEASPEERAKNRRIIQEVATQAMVDQGIW